MRVTTTRIDGDHWSTDWVPISYRGILSDKQLQKSYTFLWDEDFTVLALARAYFCSTTRLELGDVWLNESCRGTTIDGNKTSVVFLRRAIAKIWQLCPKATQISLVVASDNIAAIKLYQRLGFQVAKQGVKKPQLGITDGLAMVRHKR